MGMQEFIEATNNLVLRKFPNTIQIKGNAAGEEGEGLAGNSRQGAPRCEQAGALSARLLARSLILRQLAALEVEPAESKDADANEAG